MNAIANGIKSKSIVKKMPRRTKSQNRSIIAKQFNANKSRACLNHRICMFKCTNLIQTSLPMNQPLNSNAPHSGYSPTISFFQCYHSCSSDGTSCPSTHPTASSHLHIAPPNTNTWHQLPIHQHHHHLFHIWETLHQLLHREVKKAKH